MAHCHFDTLLTKNVPHILESIFFSLDFESFKACFEVSNTWNTLLKSEMFHKKAMSIFHEDILEDQEKLHRASEDGNTNEVRRISSFWMVDVNCVRKDGSYSMLYNSTPLSVAAYMGHKEVVQLLYDRGADREKVEGSGWTALDQGISILVALDSAICSSTNGYKDMMKMLLDLGAKSNTLLDLGALVPLCPTVSEAPMMRPVKEWHNSVTTDLRNHLFHKL